MKIREINDAIKYYKGISIKFSGYVFSRNDIWYANAQIINPFLTEQAYKLPSIKYSDIIYNYQHQSYYTLQQVYAASMNQSNNDADLEGKYENTDEDNFGKMTLRTKHILAAHAFMIVYDITKPAELTKVKRYLDEIFEMKGYDKLHQKMKDDGMCLFPVLLVGVNLDKVKDHSQKVSLAQISKIALEYCVDQDRIRLFRDYKRGSAYNDRKAEVANFIDLVLDYYKYRSLTDDEINALKKQKDIECLIL